MKTNGVSFGAAFGNVCTQLDWTWANITQSGTILAQFVPCLTPNGIPFTRLAEHGLTNRANSVEWEASDGDGDPNLHERIADTNPSSDTSKIPALRIEQDAQGKAEASVAPTSPARTYCLLSATELVTGAEWPASVCVPGTGSNVVFAATDNGTATFYRLRIAR